MEYMEMWDRTDILAEFYIAKQEEGEDVTHCGLRLEELMNIASTNWNMTDIVETLRSAFYHGLRSTQMKSIARYKFHTALSFDEIRIAIHQLELEINQRTDTKHQELTEPSH